jgi:hypothetical protein
MLDPWIIEQIRRREEEERRHQEERPSLELPLDRPPEPAERSISGNSKSERPERGIAILNYQI